MEKLQNIGHDIYEHALCALCGLAALLQANLRKLDIPIAENIPDEIIELLNGDAELESLEIVRNLFDEVVIELGTSARSSVAARYVPVRYSGCRLPP